MNKELLVTMIVLVPPVLLVALYMYFDYLLNKPKPIRTIMPDFHLYERLDEVEKTVLKIQNERIIREQSDVFKKMVEHDLAVIRNLNRKKRVTKKPNRNRKANSKGS